MAEIFLSFHTDETSYDNFDVLTALNSQDLAYAISNLQGGTSVQALMKLSNIYVSCINSDVSNFQISLINFLSKIGQCSRTQIHVSSDQVRACATV